MNGSDVTTLFPLISIKVTSQGLDNSSINATFMQMCRLCRISTSLAAGRLKLGRQTETTMLHEKINTFLVCKNSFCDNVLYKISGTIFLQMLCIEMDLGESLK